ESRRSSHCRCRRRFRRRSVLFLSSENRSGAMARSVSFCREAEGQDPRQSRAECQLDDSVIAFSSGTPDCDFPGMRLCRHWTVEIHMSQPVEWLCMGGSTDGNSHVSRPIVLKGIGGACLVGPCDTRLACASVLSLVSANRSSRLKRAEPLLPLAVIAS